MIIDNLHIVRAIRLPAKAYPPLIVDPNAVLPFSSILQGLETIAGRHA